MKNQHKSYSIYGLLVLFSISSSSFATKITQERCWGGEGPKPLLEMGSLAPSLNVVQTEGSVSEFMVWENRNAVIYRNESKEVRGSFLSTGFKKYYGKSDFPLSKVTDPGERFILASGLGWVWDWFKGAWKAVGPKTGNLEHLYWELDEVYSMSRQTYMNGHRFHFYRYGEDSKSAVPFCTWDAPIGREYRLAYGHQFPYVFFHSSEKVRGQNVLYLDKVDLMNCEIVQELSYKAFPLEGEIEDVYRYEDIDAVGVRINHSSKNFLWDNGTGTCKMYDVQAQSVAALNSRQPILAAWSEQDGLSVITLRDESAKRAKIMNVMPVERLVYKDFWLTQDGKRLFFSPRLKSSFERPILEIRFDKVL